ncbi:RICIN domain-containing protein [Streptomyces sp. NRRL S-646]|uniref:RICIN domain-containing protein n=1 Tax=Streptomyces sp. NRRL S-646 TaxID=1463917 RepID=UPI00133123E9|nr:RICIN domain-containing protein [Streptomyces sp. NRRL S-646]
MKSLKALRLAVPMGLAALMLTVAGSMSTASATTYWTYRNDYEGNCLVSSTASNSVWSDTCNDSLSTRNWYWGASSYTRNYDGLVFRRLVSKANGDCLTTDANTDTNAVWMSPCGNAPGQWWNANGNDLECDIGPGSEFLRTSANGDAVYTTPYLYQNGIDPQRYVWWGAHS